MRPLEAEPDVLEAPAAPLPGSSKRLAVRTSAATVRLQGFQADTVLRQPSLVRIWTAPAAANI